MECLIVAHETEFRVYDIVAGQEFNHCMSDSAGSHMQDPKPTVCMSGTHAPGVEGSKTFYIEIEIKGKCTTTTMADYALKGGTCVKCAQVEGPNFRCPLQQATRRALDKKRSFRGLHLRARKAAECVDKPVSASELKMHGKTNEA